MIPSITYDNIIRKIKSTLATQAELSQKLFFNATSIRGADIFNSNTGLESEPLWTSNVFVVFEMLEDDNGKNVVLHEQDDSISSISSFKFNLKIYGDECHNVSQKILMRFKTEEVALDLRNSGIFIDSISFPTCINEFINNTLWARCDMSLNIQVRFNINPVDTTPYADGISGITIDEFSKIKNNS